MKINTTTFPNKRLPYKSLLLLALSILPPSSFAISSSLDGAGPFNGIEWQVDMPWRMEPYKALISNADERENSKTNSSNYALAGQVQKRLPAILTDNFIDWKGNIKENFEEGLISVDRYTTQYDPIPLTFTIHDVLQQEGLAENKQRILLNKFCGLYVIEFQPNKTEPETTVTFIPPNEFYEMEASVGWGTDEGDTPEHQIRRLWKNESPNDLLNMSQWNEWHGTAYYTPISGAPQGKDLRIIAAARVSMSSTCSDQYFSASDIVNKLRRNNQFHPEFNATNFILSELRALREIKKDKAYKGKLLNDHINQLKSMNVDHSSALKTLYEIRSSPHIYTVEVAYAYFLSKNNPNDLGNLIFTGTDKINQEDSLFFGDFLRTHYASKPMPRFSDEWAYGDLHYHSQGTDNDGESGTSYRSALASMKALGMDYAFATDHASNSDQITGIESYEVNASAINDETPWYVPDFLIEKAAALVNGFVGGIPAVQYEALRDMSPERFDYLLGWLQGDEGGNQEVIFRPGSKRVPQIFLGGEVDVIPEVSIEDAEKGSYSYGDDKRYHWLYGCRQFGLSEDIYDFFGFTERCVQRGLQKPNTQPNGRVSLTDVQGPLETDHFARQHLLYLPYQVDPSVDNRDTFVASNTSTYGGASKHLNKVLDDIEEKDLGFTFLAHPASAASGNGIGRLGPDIYPYSEAQLEVAFASPHVLGLQLWNENAIFHSSDSYDNAKFPFLHGTLLDKNDQGNIDWGLLDWRWDKMDTRSRNSSLINGTVMWDLVNLWGITPEKTDAINLTDGTPRKFFMAGGSDAHGDMNYRREGQIYGWAKTNDTAMGTPRNLTYLSPKPENSNNESPIISQDQVINGLRSGRFSVTDGPALRIAIDTNNNGIIDDQDIHMGGDATLVTAQGSKQSALFPSLPTLQTRSSSFDLIVEWKSTIEWGSVKKIQLLLGVQEGSRKGLVYQHRSGEICGNGNLLKDADGREYCPTVNDQYIKDPTDKLTINIPQAKGMSGKQVIKLDTYDYKLFDKVCSQNRQRRQQRVKARFVRPSKIGGAINDPILGLDPIPLPPANPLTCRAENIATPQRLFIRAIASTIDTTNPPVENKEVSPVNENIVIPLKRMAYSNPIWVRDIPKGIPSVVSSSL